MNKLALLACLLATFALAPAANATVTQPNGMVVPVDSMNGEVQLYTLFQNRGEAIDYQADGHDMPAVFSPLCGFTAEYVLNQAGSHFGLAWYNVDPTATQPPMPAQLHVIVPANSPVGAMINSANILSDPGYAGGLIGFALVGGQTHYTEKQWNPTCTGCANPGPWMMAVMYRSVVTPNAYYVAFEDGNVDATSFNNDGDYNDDVFLLTGLACSGEGQPCDTGMPGVCSSGVTACDNTGALACHPSTTAMPTETCDGLDNNCDGSTDEGNPCPSGMICDRAQCREPCGSGEFPCNIGLVCNDANVCVEPECQTVTCPAGQVCHAGACQDACSGVACPHDQVCRAGRCVDPCAGVTCAAMHVCQSGVCVTSCDCLPCPSGTACGTQGACVEPACASQTCGAGTHCAGGSCVDDCAGVACPTRQICRAGECVDDPDAGSGVDASVGDAARDGSTTGNDGGRMDGGRSDAALDARSSGDGATRADGAGGDGSLDGGTGQHSGGCGCAVPGGGAKGRAETTLVALGLAAVARARRRRRA